MTADLACRRPLPMLTPCAHAGCKRLCHLRCCPEHADDDQRDAQAQLDEVRLEHDLAYDRLRELRERAAVLEDRLGIRRA